MREVMIAASIPPGPDRCPEDLRQSFGVQAIIIGVPPNSVPARWPPVCEDAPEPLLNWSLFGRPEPELDQRLSGQLLSPTTNGVRALYLGSAPCAALSSAAQTEPGPSPYCST